MFVDGQVPNGARTSAGSTAMLGTGLSTGALKCHGKNNEYYHILGMSTELQSWHKHVLVPYIVSHRTLFYGWVPIGEIQLTPDAQVNYNS